MSKFTILDGMCLAFLFVFCLITYAIIWAITLALLIIFSPIIIIMLLIK